MEAVGVPSTTGLNLDVESSLPIIFEGDEDTLCFSSWEVWVPGAIYYLYSEVGPTVVACERVPV